MNLKIFYILFFLSSLYERIDAAYTLEINIPDKNGNSNNTGNKRDVVQTQRKKNTALNKKLRKLTDNLKNKRHDRKKFTKLKNSSHRIGRKTFIDPKTITSAINGTISPTVGLFTDAIKYIPKMGPKFIKDPSAIYKDIYNKNKDSIIPGTIGGTIVGYKTGETNRKDFKERFKKLQDLKFYKNVLLENEIKCTDKINNIVIKTENLKTELKSENDGINKLLNAALDSIRNKINKRQEFLENKIMKNRIKNQVQKEVLRMRRRLKKQK